MYISICHVMTDWEVRCFLQMPSIECMIRRKRLVYTSRLLRFGPACLRAMLQLNYRGERMPWAQLLLNDLAQLRMAVPDKLGSLPDPKLDPRPWVTIMVTCPAEWRELVYLYVGFVSSLHKPTQDSDEGSEFVCTDCQSKFHTERALKSHCRSKHFHRNPVYQFVDSSGICPGCQTNYHTRLRVLSHITDKRRPTCHNYIMAGNCTIISEQELQKCVITDRAARLQAQRTGRTHPQATAKPVNPAV